MEFSKEKIKQIKNLMVLAAFLVLAIIYSEKIFSVAVFLVDILKPFIYGGAIAFVLNIPMRLIEKKFSERWKGKRAKKLKRPLSMVFSIVLIVLLFSVAIGMVLPQMGLTVSEIGRKIPTFMEQLALGLEQLAEDNPVLADWANELKNIEVK